jgi:hypothetical protein
VDSKLGIRNHLLQAGTFRAARPGWRLSKGLGAQEMRSALAVIFSKTE